MMSASAPAGMANKNIGRLLATCTMETMNGSGFKLVMSQADATLYIQPPMLETTVAIQINANTRWRSGAHTEAGAGAGEVAEGSLTLALEDNALASLIRRVAVKSEYHNLGGSDLRGPR